MKFSTRTRYGIRAILEIAINENGTGVFQKDIAINQKLSNKYLDHIISSLKIAGLICNVKGKKSGYILTRPPDQITMLDVHNAFEPEICVVECLSGIVKCEMQETCVTQEFWQGLNNRIEDYLKGVSLADLLKKNQTQNLS